MAEILRLPFVRHLRAEPTSHVLLWKGGQRKRSGAGLAFWFSPLGTSIAEVPLDDRDLPFVFRGRTSDFQAVAVNGVVAFRVLDPDRLAGRIDFSIDARSGAWNKDPLDKVALVVSQLALQRASTFLIAATLEQVLAQGIEGLRASIHSGLVEDPVLDDLGLGVVGTRIASVAPSAEMEKALMMPTRERVQQSADEATFARRALAVEKERAIQENELGTQIELARREETLIAQRGQNERRRATEAGESKRIEAEASAMQARIAAEAQAGNIAVVERARVGAERERMDIYRDLPQAAMWGLAARELAGKLQKIEHLNLGPEVLGPLLQRVLTAQANTLEKAADVRPARREAGQ
jgi:regulator of protease activity HflC (stomatin/prohibitin superfamily)